MITRTVIYLVYRSVSYIGPPYEWETTPLPSRSESSFCWADLLFVYGNSYDLCYLNIYGLDIAGLVSSYFIHLYTIEYLW